MKLSKPVVVLTLILSVNLPTQAASKLSKSSNQLSFIDQIDSLFSSARQYVLQISLEFSQTFGELSGEVQSAIESSIGSLGIPDPIKAGKKIEEIISERDTNTLDIPAGVQGVDARYDWDEQYAQAQSRSVLGSAGQSQMALDSHNTVQASQNSENEAIQAQNDLTTQDLLRRQLRQNAFQMQALQAVQRSLQDHARLAATNGLSLQNIASRANSKERQEQIEARADLQSALQVAGFQNGLLAERTGGAR